MTTLLINGALLLLLLLVVADADADAVPSSSDVLQTAVTDSDSNSNVAAPQQSSSSSSSSAAAAVINKTETETETNRTQQQQGGGFYRGMSREFVAEHNKVRARYGAPPLSWDKALALYARRWAAAVAQDCSDPRHSGGEYGESFFLGANGTARDALFNWEKEEAVYDRATHGCTAHHNFQDCGHFAIMVNPRFRWVGCARTRCRNYAAGHLFFFVTCNYNPTPPS